MPLELTEHFDTRTLIGVINSRPRKPRLFTQLFFRNRNAIATAIAELFVIVHGNKMAPFVSKSSAGVVVDKLGFNKRQVETPRLRPKKRFSAPELLDKIMAGQSPYVQPGADVSAVIESKLAADMDELLDQVEMTIEWMAAQALTGSMSVQGEDLDFEIDFLMPPSHKVILATEYKWNQESVDPTDSLEEFSKLILDSCGLAGSVAVMGTNAWPAFRKNEFVRKDLDNTRMPVGSLPQNLHQYYKGNYKGTDLYCYGGTCTDAKGNTKQLLDPNYVVVGSPDAETEITFGLPEDLEANGKAMELFAKSWTEKDPSLVWLLAESRPLPWPRQPDAFVYAKVV